MAWLPARGVYRDPIDAPTRRARLDVILKVIPSLAFDDAAADAYAVIVAHAGYSRRKLIDHMIAAHAREGGPHGAGGFRDGSHRQLKPERGRHTRGFIRPLDRLV